MNDQVRTISAPIERRGRQGFLPFITNTFDRYFISVVIFIAISLLWMRFIEPLGPSVWFAAAISAVVGFIIVTRG